MDEHLSRGLLLSRLATKARELDLSVESTLHWRSAHALVQWLVSQPECFAAIAADPESRAAMLRALDGHEYPVGSGSTLFRHEISGDGHIIPLPPSVLTIYIVPGQQPEGEGGDAK